MWLFLAAVASPGKEPLVFRQAADVRSLSRETAAENHLAVLRGVVTYVKNESRDRGPVEFSCFLEDETSAIFVSATSRLGDPMHAFSGESMPQVGEVIEVRGVTGPGGFAPVLMAHSFERIGRSPLPTARPTRLADLRRGRLDSHRVQLAGVVRRAYRNKERGWIGLEIESWDGLFRVFVDDAEDASERELVDASVEVIGVCSMLFNSRGESHGVALRTRNMAEVKIVTPARDTFAGPMVSSVALRPFAPDGANLHRHRLKGVVTLSRPGEAVYVHAGERGFRVETRETEVPPVGAEVEAAGFVELGSGFGKLVEGVFRTVGTGTQPEPQAVSLHELMADLPSSVSQWKRQDFDGELICLNGTLVRMENERRRMYLDCGGGLTMATLAQSAPEELKPGSVLRLTGVCQIELNAFWPAMTLPIPTHAILHLRSPEDITVLAAPSWWTPQRLLAALVIAAVAALLLALWNVALQRRVIAQTALIGERIARESRLEERQRIGRELHDTLQQELTGVGMLIDNSRAHLRAPEKAEPLLAMAGRILQRCREESRSSIQELMSASLEHGGLKKAIEELVRPLAEIRGAAFHTSFPEPIPDLPGRLATTLLRIAHEAVANAGKHSGASHIWLDLRVANGRLDLEVRDDGCGFDVASADASSGKNFGLLLMEERALRRRGRFSIESKPGEGTHVRVSLPLDDHA